MFDALVAAQNRISSGEIKAVLPEKPTDAELATWRKDNGIPEKPEGYKVDGIQDEDKGFFDDFMKEAHGNNYTPDQAKAVVDWYYKSQEAEITARHEQDEDEKQAAMDELNIEWGSDFRRNMNMVDNLLTMVPESARDDLKGARMPDGTGIFNNPDVVRGFAAVALALNPAGTVVPLGSDPMKGVAEEIKDIETFMKEHRKAYDKDEEKQGRLRELYGIRQNLDRKAG